MSPDQLKKNHKLPISHSVYELGLTNERNPPRMTQTPLFASYDNINKSGHWAPQTGTNDVNSLIWCSFTIKAKKGISISEFN